MSEETYKTDPENTITKTGCLAHHFDDDMVCAKCLIRQGEVFDGGAIKKICERQKRVYAMAIDRAFAAMAGINPMGIQQGES